VISQISQKSLFQSALQSARAAASAFSPEVPFTEGAPPSPLQSDTSIAAASDFHFHVGPTSRDLPCYNFIISLCSLLKFNRVGYRQ
jgi:hypothetical protein